jgi:hypothetical protein
MMSSTSKTGAVIDRHRAVGTLGHDLHRRPSGRGDFDPDKPQAEIAQDWRGDACDSQTGPGVRDQTRLVQSVGGTRDARTFSFDHATLPQQKRAGPGWAPLSNTLFVMTTKSYETVYIAI